MRYSVNWHPEAERRLTEIWLSSAHRQSVTQAANQIDRDLADDPVSRGEDFYGDFILACAPLGVVYTVSQADRRVQVVRVWTENRDAKLE